MSDLGHGLAHHNAPETSAKAAAEGDASGLFEIQAVRVLDIITEFGPLTDMEIVTRYVTKHGDKPADGALRARRNNLMDQDLVGDTGQRTTNPDSNKNVVLWGLTSQIPEAQRRVNQYKRTNARAALTFALSMTDTDEVRMAFLKAWNAEDWTLLDSRWPRFIVMAMAKRHGDAA